MSRTFVTIPRFFLRSIVASSLFQYKSKTGSCQTMGAQLFSSTLSHYDDSSYFNRLCSPARIIPIKS
jgi:hypothetical protein